MTKPPRQRTNPKDSTGTLSHAPATDERRSARLSVALVLLVAVLIRVIYFLQYQADVPYFSAIVLDSTYYDSWAWRVAQGQGYGPMPFYMAPLYPYAVAVIYVVAGHSLGAVYALQLILGVVNLLLTYMLGRRLFGHMAGLLAMILMTAYAPLVYLETKILTETLALTLNLTSLLLLMSAMRRPTALRFVTAGLILGISAVCRPSALVTVMFVVGWLLVTGLRGRGSQLRHAAVLALGVVITILPVTARNYFVGHDVALLSTNGGIVFTQANHHGADGISAALDGFTGSIMTQQEEEMAVASKALGHAVKPSESSAYWLGKGMQFVREQPLEFIALLGRKAFWSLHNTEADCSYNVYLERTLVPTLRLLALPFWLLAGLALFGLVRRADSEHPGQGSALLGVYAASVFVGLVVFSVSSRYRVPAIPAMCVFAGYGLVRLGQSLSHRHAKEILVGTACVCAFVLVSLVRYPLPAITAVSLANLGTSYITCGQKDEGIAALDRSLRMDEDQASVHHNLGTALMLAGDANKAAGHFSRAIEISPEQAEFHNSIGLAYLRKGDVRRAEQSFLKAIRLRPELAEAHVGMSNVLQQTGRMSEAAKERAIANRIQPDLARMHFDAGCQLHAQGNLAEAVRQYREAIWLKPNNPDAYANLGLALKDQGKLAESVQAYRAAVRIKPDLNSAQNNLAIALFYQGKYADAWTAVHALREHGGKPHPGFVQALSQKMHDPGK